MNLHAIPFALGFASANALAGAVIMIDPDGLLGPDPTIAVGSLGWNNGNALSVTLGVGSPALNGPVQNYGQAGLANFNDGSGNVIPVPGLNSNYQWTYVFGTREQSTAALPLITLQSISGGENFFRIYYNGPAGGGVVQNNLNGTGFTAGQLILSGTIEDFNPLAGTGAASFVQTSTTTGPLDQFSANNYPGIVSGSGVGTGNFVIGDITADTDFFKVIPSSLSIVLDAFQSTPFNHVDPSSCFTNAAGLTIVPGAGPNTAGGSCANGIGTNNGVDGSNVIFETRATTDFRVPEPLSITLVCMGLLSMLGLSRKRV
jgi:hypothetical protein